jgi:phosphatidylinositol-4,5-bisphosphate 3-kinase/phosphatidylinositol-4-phosphate 3-kinase
LLSCIDYKNSSQVKELEKILKLSHPLNPVEALLLLTGKYLHENIRKFAVKCLEQSTYIQVQDYIIQLVQALKYEMYHDSHLARYLIKMALRYPLTIGHYLFWNLRSEMHNPIVQQRFGLYLEIFLNNVGKYLRKIFEDEAKLIKDLIDVADIPHSKVFKTEEEKLLKFKEALSNINNRLFIYGQEISLPLNFKMRVKNVNL